MRIGVLIVGMLSVGIVHAYLYTGVVMRRWDADRHAYQWFIGLGDYHTVGDKATHEQKSTLKKIFQDLDRKRYQVLVEDLTFQGAAFAQVRQFTIDSRANLLGGLTSWCRSYGLAVKNLEYRYARVCALAPLLQVPGLDPHRVPSAQGIFMEDLVKEMVRVQQKIAHYRDGARAQRWYAAAVAAARDLVQRYVAQYNRSDSVADYLARVPVKQRYVTMQKILVDDTYLFDMQLLHAAISSAKERVLAITGGSHIQRVVPLLQQLGYEVVHAVPQQQAVAHGAHAACAVEDVIRTPQATGVVQPLSVQEVEGCFVVR